MPRAQRISNLVFDSSGSAVIRIVSRPLQFLSHYPEQAVVAPARTGCPRDIDETSPCMICDNRGNNRAGIREYTRYAMYAWDCRNCKYVFYVSTQTFMSNLQKLMRDHSVSQEQLCTGVGPDIAITKERMNVNVEFLMRTLGEERGTMIPRPSENDLGPQIIRISHWSSQTYEEVIEAYARERQDNRAYSVTPQNLPIPTPPQESPRRGIDFAAALEQLRDRDRTRITEIPQVEQAPPKPTFKPAEEDRIKLPDNEDLWDVL